MNVKQLINYLSEYPDDMEVMVNSINGEFQYGTVESVLCKNIRFSDDDDEVDGDFTAYADCIVISE